ncbi:glycosyltransferase [Colwellia sp. 6_MG-2023]|uniref:glycosyltransferase n=1 Tax=Colwellia sp. 6_MG-2023 TaxID=3062676 RepID=UPI0026E232B3|nr:glycosyltransferase [Colwellia sp. 6_MG-2023]MDO6487703.1 glycosyltransferase [Colwellia sp. 6_MG-2023]
MSKTILMIAFEFPPSNGASVPRIESFYRYLKAWGWKVIVLTAKPHAYVNKDNTYTDSTDDLIFRTTALDVQRQLSFKGKYLEVMATPDRWGLTWIPSAIAKGRTLIKKYQPDVIWSSSPIPSTHFIANKLSKGSHIPWVADYRDPFHYMNGTAGKWLDKFHKRIDQTTLNNASHITFATSAVRDLYEQKYQEIITKKNTVIENGYDEANFEKLATLKNKATPFAEQKFTLYYSGVLYANGRDPVPVFNAISRLKALGHISNNDFELIFQGAGNGEDFNDLISELNIQNMVKFISPVPFLNALNNMINADALLLIQDKRFNKQIPGKIYEYLRTNKPLLVKADTNGETYKLATQFKNVHIGNTTEEIQSSVLTLILKDKIISERSLDNYNRKGKAKILESLLIKQIT